ncbi:RNA-guided endonuclease InsQ/TnpB family protein, partial [Neisseria sp. P0016.S006]
VSIQTEFETETPKPNGGEIGIDMGIVRFATLSNGEYFEPINAFKNLKGKLAKLQKRFKNKTKFSKNWQKLKAKIAKLHHKISNIRKNYLHQISSQISKNHAIVYVEDLQVANMSKSAKGNAEQHGKNVKQKSGLNRAILDQSWAEFRRQLAHKLAWNGG